MKIILAFVLASALGLGSPAAAAPRLVPLCKLGCIETDPAPNAPGIFLTSAVTDETCFAGGHTDADADGLSDRCETDIAAAFAPELFHWRFDNVGREPHWAARPSGDQVVIAYLLSYYRDEGSSAWACSLPLVAPHCQGHNGDSEWILLTVYYDWPTHHWLLQQALYSQHTSFGTYARGSNAYPTALEYPGRLGGYPRSYVAEGKHANYPSRSACNSGGTLGTDTCTQVDTAARVAGGGNVNIRSRAVHMASQDCMVSANPSYIYYGSGRQECYWTNRRFRGWIPTTVGGDDSTAYSGILADHGF